MSRRAELEAYATESDKAADRFDAAATDADQVARTETDPKLRAGWQELATLHRQHAADAREDARTYRDGRTPGDNS